MIAQTMPTAKPKVTVIFDESTMLHVKDLAESEYRSLSQMVAVLVREAIESRRDRQPTQGDNR